MIKLKDAIIPKPSFEKVANYELSKDIGEWNEQILKDFYEEINFLPKEIGVNVIIKDVDENKGYGKGSIVVFFNNKQINFPIIIRDFKLSPFDIFAHKKSADERYYPATETNVKKILMSDEIATLENRWDQARGYQMVKSPGGIIPKQSINLYDAPEESLYPPFAKMSGWVRLANKEDMEKVAGSLVGMPDVAAAFHDNTGDLVNNLIQLKPYQREETIPNDHRYGKINLNNIINAKKALTAIDSEFIDTSKLIPLEPPSVAEVRIYEYPSMEDFLDSGSNIAERFVATKIGKPIVGVVLDLIDRDRDSMAICGPSLSSLTIDEKKKLDRERQDQVFISLCGKFFSKFDDWDKTGVGFYGSKILQAPDAVEKAIKMLSIGTTDDFINTNPENYGDGSDKLFAGINTMRQGKDRDGNGGRYLENSSCNQTYKMGLFVIYATGPSYECREFYGEFRKYMVNNSHVYVSKDHALIPANVASFQKVSKVEDPVYKMIVGKCKNICLFPEGALIVNKHFLKELNKSDFMRPELSVQRVFEEKNINKVAMCVMSDGKQIGYHIDGKPFEPMSKIANLNGKLLTTDEAKAALRIMGMNKTASDNAMATALNRYSDMDCYNKNVTIYGVRNDYVNPEVFAENEKTARVKDVLNELAYNLRKDLVKEASMLTDPESVDVVLSLNFINGESLGNYIENIDKMKDVLSELSKLLVASRMGLSEIDETATKNAITGLSDVIEGLESIKMSVK